MPDKKLTDAEIKKALECCILGRDCNECPMSAENSPNCWEALRHNSLDLINRLQGKVEFAEKIYLSQSEELQILKDKNKVLATELANSLQDAECLQAENKRLSTLAELGNKRANDYRVMRDRALKAEAENERLKEEICIQHKIVDERGKEILRHDRCIRTLHEELATAKAEAYKECIEKAKERCIGFPRPNNLLAIRENLDNLLKEMGANNAKG